MSTLQKTSRLARALLTARPMMNKQVYAPALTRCLTEEQRKKRDAYREKMQYPDDTPVYLRGGPMDRTLFLFTCFLVGTGTLMVVYRVYVRAQA